MNDSRLIIYGQSPFCIHYTMHSLSLVPVALSHIANALYVHTYLPSGHEHVGREGEVGRVGEVGR